jgi:hypothetical protein
MTHWVEKLMASLHRVFAQDPVAEIALRIHHPIWYRWTVSGNTLTLTQSGYPDTVITLADKTLATLAAAVDALPEFSVTLAAEWSGLSALALLNGSGQQSDSNGNALRVFTSDLWRLLSGAGDAIGQAADAIPQAIAQVYLGDADGEWLDEHGRYYGITRLLGESDDAYLDRIITEIMLPRANNRAIAIIFARLFKVPSWSIEVTDDPQEAYDPVPPSGHQFHHAEFSVNFRVAPLQPVGLDELNVAVDRFKAAGTRLASASTAAQFNESWTIASGLKRPVGVLSVGMTARHDTDSLTRLLGTAAGLKRPVGIINFRFATGPGA